MADLVVRRIENREEVKRVKVDNISERYVDRVVAGMLINMDTDRFFVDLSEVEAERAELERLRALEPLDRFLAELTALTRKYGLVIKGCGCHGSPWVEQEPVERGEYTINPARTLDGSIYAGDLTWGERT